MQRRGFLRKNVATALTIALFAGLSLASNMPKKRHEGKGTSPKSSSDITASCNAVVRSGMCRQFALSPPSQGGAADGINRFLPTVESECKDAGGKVQVPAAPCPTENGLAAIQAELAPGFRETFLIYGTTYLDEVGPHVWTMDKVDAVVASEKCRAIKCVKARFPGAAPAEAAAHGVWTVAPAGPVEGALRDAVNAAASEGTVPVAYVHAKWCGPCRAIDKYKDEPRMAKAFAGTHVVSIDLDRADEAELHRLGMATHTLPVFYALGADGRATRDSIDGGAWGENVPENMAPPLERFFTALAMGDAMKRKFADGSRTGDQQALIGRGDARAQR